MAFEFRTKDTPKLFEMVAIATLVAKTDGTRISCRNQDASDITPMGTIDVFEFDNGKALRIFCGSFGFTRVVCNCEIANQADILDAFASVIDLQLDFEWENQDLGDK